MSRGDLGGLTPIAVRAVEAAVSAGASDAEAWAEESTSRRVRVCSRMWAAQPPVRAQVNIEVNMLAGTSAKSRTIAAQNSTFVASTRSGRRLCSSVSAARSSASATSYRGASSSLAVRRSTRARGSSAR